MEITDCRPRAIRAGCAWTVNQWNIVCDRRTGSSQQSGGSPLRIARTASAREKGTRNGGMTTRAAAQPAAVTAVAAAVVAASVICKSASLGACRAQLLPARLDLHEDNRIIGAEGVVPAGGGAATLAREFLVVWRLWDESRSLDGEDLLHLRSCSGRRKTPNALTNIPSNVFWTVSIRTDCVESERKKHSVQ